MAKKRDFSKQKDIRSQIGQVVRLSNGEYVFRLYPDLRKAPKKLVQYSPFWINY